MWKRSKSRKRKAVQQLYDYETLKQKINEKFQNLSREKQESLASLENERKITQKRLACLRARKHRGMVLHDIRDMEERLRSIDGEIERLHKDEDTEAMAELFVPLVKGARKGSSSKTRQQLKALSTQLFDSNLVVPTFVETESCAKCNRDFVLFARESKIVCPQCGRAEEKVPCKTDFMEMGESRHVNSDPRPTFEKFLMQFWDKAEDTPAEVYDAIALSLNNVHIMTGDKLKPTIISQILRKSGMQKWSSRSIRIQNELTNKPVAKLSMELIRRMCLRFSKVWAIWLQSKKLENKKKIMKHDYLAQKFLQMEGEMEKAKCFECHKTRLVLRNADARLLKCVEVLRKTDDTMKWTFVPSF